MNAVLVGVSVMLALSLARVNVVFGLAVGAFAGGLAAGMPVADAGGQTGVLTHFQNGLAGGAKIALSYAMLGAFAMVASAIRGCRSSWQTGWFAVRARLPPIKPNGC